MSCCRQFRALFRLNYQFILIIYPDCYWVWQNSRYFIVLTGSYNESIFSSLIFNFAFNYYRLCTTAPEFYWLIDFLIELCNTLNDLVSSLYLIYISLWRSSYTRLIALISTFVYINHLLPSVVILLYPEGSYMHPKYNQLVHTTNILQPLSLL